MTRIVAADIGGTHARFALADVERGRVRALDRAVTFRTADHASLFAAWTAFAAECGRTLPRAAAIAVASPVGGDTIKLTNNPWLIRPGSLDADLGIDTHVLINDFGAVGHAVAQTKPDDLVHLCGLDVPLPDDGVITVCGPGTGLGVAQVVRAGGQYQVIETEGGHMDYAPLDAVEDAVVQRLRAQLGRVSVERVAAGPGILPIYETLAAGENQIPELHDERSIWAAALDGSDPLSRTALDRFLRILGAVAGDLALAHGAKAVVIAGGLGYRLRDLFAGSGFAARFAAKGRFQSMMAAIPVKLIVHPEPGLFGAAAAFAQEHRE